MWLLGVLAGQLTHRSIFGLFLILILIKFTLEEPKIRSPYKQRTKNWNCVKNQTQSSLGNQRTQGHWKNARQRRDDIEFSTRFILRRLRHAPIFAIQLHDVGEKFSERANPKTRIGWRRHSQRRFLLASQWLAPKEKKLSHESFASLQQQQRLRSSDSKTRRPCARQIPPANGWALVFFSL